MGKFNWKGAAKAGLAYYLNQNMENQDQKRAYERQDREMAAQLYGDMLKSGMDTPDVNQFGPVFKELANKYREQLPVAKQKALDEELIRLEAGEQIKQKYDKPDKLSETEKFIYGPPEYQQRVMDYWKVKAQASKDPDMQAMQQLLQRQTAVLNDMSMQQKTQDLTKGELDITQKNLAIDKAKTEAAKVKKPEDAFNYMANSIEGTYEAWKNVPKEVKGKYKNAWYEAQKSANIEALANDPTYGPYTISRDALAIDLATAWEPTQGGGVQRLSDQDIKRYTDMNVTLATSEDEAAWNKKEQLKKVVARKMGVDYKIKQYPGDTKSDVNKKKLLLKQKEEEAAKRGLLE